MPSVVEDKSNSTWTVDSLAQVAEFFGVAYDTVLRSWRPSGMPGSARCWDLAAIAKWRHERDVAGGRGNGERSQAELKAEKLERESALLEQRERAAKLENDATERRLVDREIVERRGAEFALMVKDALEAFPDEVESEMPRKIRATVRDVATSVVHRILTKMASWEPFAEDDS